MGSRTIPSHHDQYWSRHDTKSAMFWDVRQSRSFICAGIPSLCHRWIRILLKLIISVSKSHPSATPGKGSWRDICDYPRSELACMLLPKVQAFQELILKIEIDNPVRRLCRDDARTQTGHRSIEWRGNISTTTSFRLVYYITALCWGHFIPSCLRIRRRYK